MKHIRCLLAFAGILALGAGSAGAVLTTIPDIQQGMHDEGTEVTVENVVVTASGFWGFFIQEQNDGPYANGMYTGILVHTAAAHVGDIKRGDVVTVTGSYEEYYDLSEIDMSEIGSYEITGTAEVPEPYSLLITEINDSGPYNEAYESVLLRVDREDETLFAGQPNQYDDWHLFTDMDAGGVTGDSLMMNLRSADPNGDFSYTLPDSGDPISFAAGILIYEYGQYKLAPRNCPDDLGMPCPPVLLGMWTYDNTHVDVHFAVDVDEESAEDVFNYTFYSGLEVLVAERDETNHRMVRLATGEHSVGVGDIGYVDGVLSEEDLIMIDPPGEFAFTQGLVSIYEIQFTDDYLEDASEFDDRIVTTTGRVATIERDRYCYLQHDDAGHFDHLYVRVGKVGDLAVGDSIKVAARVREYFGYTQMSHATGVQLYENLGPATQPVVRNDFYDAEELIYTSSHFNDTPPNDNRGEPWEGAYVRLATCAVLDTVAGGWEDFGEWYAIVEGDTVFTDFNDDINNEGGDITYQPTIGEAILLTGMFFYDGRYTSTYRLVPRFDADIEVCGTAADEAASIPAHPMLWQNRPNPFGPATAIAFSLPREVKDVSLEVYDVTGACLRTLLSGATLKAGPHSYHWDGTDDRGNAVASGTYFYRLRVAGQTLSKQMMMLR
jgi:hypothetical protein